MPPKPVTWRFPLELPAMSFFTERQNTIVFLPDQSVLVLEQLVEIHFISERSINKGNEMFELFLQISASYTQLHGIFLKSSSVQNSQKFSLS